MFFPTMALHYRLILMAIRFIQTEKGCNKRIKYTETRQ
jgi:hypothetical protein